MRDRRILHLSWRSAPTLIAAAIMLSACTKSPNAQARGRQDPVKPVEIENVQEQTIRRSVDVVGTLAAVDEVTVSSEADGAVAKLRHDLGDRVAAGEVLIELDREKAEYTYEQQKAALARALAQFGAPDPQHLPALEQTPDVKKAQAELIQAKQAYDRAEELNRRQLVPRQALDDAQAMLQSKQASYDSSLQSARNLRANIAAADAAAKFADRQLRDTYIRAPFDGYVAKRLVNLGELVKPQTQVMAIVRIDPLKVIAEVPEKMAPWIKVGEPVELHVDAFPDRAFAGKVSRISPSVNTATRAFPFEALVPNAEAELKPGTFARVRIASGKTDQVMTLSYAALQYRYGVNRAFVVQGDKLAARELKVGDRVGDRIEIVSGVKAGEPVAVTDVDKLIDGAKVSVRRNTE